MERVDIVTAGGVALINDLEGAVGRGADRAAGLPFIEKVVFRYFFGLGVMGDEDDLHLFVFAAEKTGHPEEKATGDIFFKDAHGAARVHHGQDDGIGIMITSSQVLKNEYRPPGFHPALSVATGEPQLRKEDLLQLFH